MVKKLEYKNRIKTNQRFAFAINKMSGRKCLQSITIQSGTDMTPKFDRLLIETGFLKSGRDVLSLSFLSFMTENVCLTFDGIQVLFFAQCLYMKHLCVITAELPINSEAV